jgi:hypothetical protein
VVELDLAATNANQGDSASAAYEWDAIQLSETDVDQTDAVIALEDANPELTGSAG